MHPPDLGSREKCTPPRPRRTLKTFYLFSFFLISARIRCFSFWRLRVPERLGAMPPLHIYQETVYSPFLLAEASFPLMLFLFFGSGAVVELLLLFFRVRGRLARTCAARDRLDSRLASMYGVCSSLSFNPSLTLCVAGAKPTFGFFF